MFNDNYGFIKGMLAGVVVGAAVSMATSKPGNRSKMRYMRRNAGKAMRAVGTFVDNVTKQ